MPSKQVGAPWLLRLATLCGPVLCSGGASLLRCDTLSYAVLCCARCCSEVGERRKRSLPLGLPLFGPAAEAIGLGGRERRAQGRAPTPDQVGLGFKP